MQHMKTLCRNMAVSPALYLAVAYLVGMALFLVVP